MASNDPTFQRGNAILEAAWELAKEPGFTSASDIPDDMRAAISQVMRTSSQLAQRYALPSQLLIKATLPSSDSRSLKGLAGGGGPLSARTFARKTVASHKGISSRLGASEDPYVSNPLRQARISDDMALGAAGATWASLVHVLDFAEAHPDLAETLLALSLAPIQEWEWAAPATPMASSPPASDMEALRAVTSLSEDVLLDIVGVLESEQPQVVFTGPPGTSKTHTALAIASYLVGDAHRVVQLHASYGYEEFVEGLRAVATDSGGFKFAIERGVVRRISEELADGQRYVLIIDEMNRANLPRVLGEMLFAIERRNQPVDLMYTHGFKLSPGLAFIGTMNTADRSIRTLDAAIRRRFQFFDFAPSPAVLAAFYEGRVNEVNDLVDGFVALNAALTALVDRHHTIGHTFFMDAKGMTAARLRQVWDRQVQPLLEDYLFDQPEELMPLTAGRFWPSTLGQ